MPWTRWRRIACYLIWLPPIVLLCVCGTYPILPSGDRRNGTWRDPREFTGDLAIYYLTALVIFRLSRRLIRGSRGLIRARNDAIRKVRQSKGQCVACGYDLCATAEGARGAERKFRFLHRGRLGRIARVAYNPCKGNRDLKAAW